MHQIRKKMKSFAELWVQKKVKVNEELVTVKASHHTFSKFLMIQRSRQIDMRDMVQYEIGPLPWALAKPNGITNISEKEVPLVHLLPKNTVKNIWCHGFYSTASHKSGNIWWYFQFYSGENNASPCWDNLFGKWSIWPAIDSRSWKNWSGCWRGSSIHSQP